jgi:type II pantothenate kinase
MVVGLDFGITNLDGAILEEGELRRGLRLDCPGASVESLNAALQHLELGFQALTAIGTTGGKHRELPERLNGVPLVKVSEADAVGRGGLRLAGLESALVVSAGTGTAMIAARGKVCTHVTGSAVGGGTLLGLSRFLLGTADPFEIARLAAKGDPSRVDGTLQDVIGGGIGHLPADATAVNLGRLAKLTALPPREDVAAGLVTLVAQVISVIALNAAKANGLERIVFVGHLVDLEPVCAAVRRVWGFYGVEQPPVIPERRGFATALGAGLVALETAHPETGQPATTERG